MTTLEIAESNANRLATLTKVLQSSKIHSLSSAAVIRELFRAVVTTISLLRGMQAYPETILYFTKSEV